jgi:hypothetical protein
MHSTIKHSTARNHASTNLLENNHKDQSNLLEKLISLLKERGIRYCVIGGQAVNAYVEPLVSLDLDLAVAVNQL